MRAIHAEVRKAVSVRTILWLAVGSVVIVGAGAVMTTSAASTDDLTGAVHDQPFFLLASVNLSVFALLVGVRSSTDEFRDGTIEWALLAVRHRWALVGAKAVVAGVAGATIAWAAVVAGTATTLLVASSRGGDLRLDGGDVRAVAGLAAASALWAGIGVGVGTVVRHPVAAAVSAAVWVFAVENVGASLLGDAGRFLPGQAAHALADVDLSSPLLATAPAAALLVGYGISVLGLAAVHIERRPLGG